jgi:bifunctional DNase/RNase
VIEMSIESIRVSLMNYQRVVILKEKASDRYLPIWIGRRGRRHRCETSGGVGCPASPTTSSLGH